MAQCQAYGIVAQVPAEDLRKILPPEYKPSGFVSAAEGQVNLLARKCEAFIINNETIIQNVILAKTEAIVSVDESLRKGSENTQFYLFEMFTSNATVANLLKAMGFPAVHANLTWQEFDTSTTLTVAVEGKVYYTAEGGNGYGPDDHWSLDDRFHYKTSSGRAIWLSENQTTVTAKAPGAGNIKVSAGVLQSLRPGDHGIITGLSTTDREFRADLSFGRTERISP